MKLTRALFANAGPTVAVEITAGHVAAASLADQGGRMVVASHAIEYLPGGAVVPSLNAANFVERQVVTDALGRLFQRVGKPRRVGLIVPDSMAKVSLVRFEKVPKSSADLDQLVRWQVRKTAPFRIEDAQVSYVEGAPTAEGGREFVVSLARRDIVEEYESVCAAAGAEAGVVDLATFNVINAVLAGSGTPDGDWLLVHAATGYTTVTIMRGADLVLFRNRPAEEEGGLADLVHQTAMYYEDRLGGVGFAKALVAGLTSAGVEGDVSSLTSGLEERLGCRVETVDPRAVAALTDRISVDAGLLDTLTPLVGLLARDRVQ